MQTNPTTTATALQLFDADEVRRALRLLLPTGQVTELRILDASTISDRWPHTASGYFGDVESLLAALQSVRSAKGVYIIPNPVNPALLARAANRIRKADKGGTTSDHDIARRHWLLVDCDPKRPDGISATDAEHEAALERCRTIWSALHFNYGWPEPIAADSGNGAHLLYRVDLPVKDDGLVQRCLAALVAQFDDDAVKVDTTVFNPARIWKLYGTLACKGDSTTDRPHRMSRILSAPDPLFAVSRTQLEELAGEVQQQPPHDPRWNGYTNGTFDIDAFIQRQGFELDGPDPYQGGRKWTFRKSPLCDHHGDGPFLIQFANGALAAGCHHDSCSWTWHDLRARYEPKASTSWYEELLGKASRKPSGNGTADKPSVEFARITSAELASGSYQVEFAIEGAMVLGQPLTIGGPMKTLKTSILIDAAVSLASGGYFLGRLRVNKPRRVLVMSGESGLATIQETACRIAEAAGCRLADLGNLVWSPDVPKFNQPDHLAALELLLQGDGIEVLFCDPAYLAMPSADAGNLMAQGELLRNISSLCQQLGVSLVMCHHTKRNTGQDAHEPLELQHLAWAGHAEFARQWWLVNRRERYEPGAGEHRLWLSIGGSAGHSSLWAVDVTEGTLADPGGRRWEVELSDAAGARDAATERKDRAKVDRTSRQLEADRTAVCRVLARNRNGLTKSAIGEHAGIHHRRLSAVIAAALDNDEIEPTEVNVGNNRRPIWGYRLKVAES